MLAHRASQPLLAMTFNGPTFIIFKCRIHDFECKFHHVQGAVSPFALNGARNDSWISYSSSQISTCNHSRDLSIAGMYIQSRQHYAPHGLPRSPWLPPHRSSRRPPSGRSRRCPPASASGSSGATHPLCQAPLRPAPESEAEFAQKNGSKTARNEVEK